MKNVKRKLMEEKKINNKKMEILRKNAKICDNL